eukprot:1158470-Pelagomonas_calceolata.AAC.1
MDLGDSQHKALILALKAWQNEGKETAPQQHPSVRSLGVFPYGSGSSAQHQSRPDAVFVRPILGRPAHLDPTNIPPQDRDIHLVGFTFCPDTNHFPIWKLQLPSTPAL